MSRYKHHKPWKQPPLQKRGIHSKAIITTVSVPPLLQHKFPNQSFPAENFLKCIFSLSLSLSLSQWSWFLINQPKQYWIKLLLLYHALISYNCLLNFFLLLVVDKLKRISKFTGFLSPSWIINKKSFVFRGIVCTLAFCIFVMRTQLVKRISFILLNSEYDRFRYWDAFRSAMVGKH